MYKLSPEVTLPKNAATSTNFIAGTRGSGKTYGAGVLVEEFLAHGVQTVVIDPVGPWYGLRIAADGKGKGFDIPVFGGEHGDVPLEPTAGALIAQIIVERRVSCVLDISDFTDGEQHRFVTSLCQTIFQLKKRNKSPLHMVFDEGHEFFPQIFGAAEMPMVGATKRLVKVGRNYGIGVTIISPRAAEVNKGAINLSDRIFTGRLKAPEDIKRIDGWTNHNGANDELISELPNLPKGTLIAWDESGATRTIFRAKRTLDTSATPDGSNEKKRRAPAPLDMDWLRTAMAATLEEAKANDPKALRARVAELERELAKKPVPVAAPAHPPKPVPAWKDSQIAWLEKLVDKLSRVEEKFVKSIADNTNTLAQRQQVVVSEIGNITAALRSVRTPYPQPRVPVPTPSAPPPPRSAPARPSSAAREGSTDYDGDLPKYALELLQVVAQRGSASDSQISTLSGYRRTSSAFPKMLARLMRDGFIEGDSKERVITAAGREVAGDVEPPPTGAALLDHWVSRLAAQEGTFLQAIHAAGTISREELCTAAAQYSNGAVERYSTTSSSFAKTISALCKLGLILKTPDGNLRISDSFT